MEGRGAGAGGLRGAVKLVGAGGGCKELAFVGLWIKCRCIWGCGRRGFGKGGVRGVCGCGSAGV